MDYQIGEYFPHQTWNFSYQYNRMTPKTTAPKHLSKDARDWWTKIQDEYGINDNAGKLLLQTALEAFDRMKSAANRINKDGAAVEDRFGQVKPHPLLPAERDARSQMLLALKQLNLDIEPLRDRPGRP